MCFGTARFGCRLKSAGDRRKISYFFFPMSSLEAEEKELQIFAMIVTERKKSSVHYGITRRDTIFFFLARSLHLQSLFRSGEWLIGKKKIMRSCARRAV